MKKKLFMLLVVFTVSVLVGCSKGVNQEDTVQSGAIAGEQIPSEVIGNVEEIKDFMLIVTYDANVSYAFTFEEKPEGVDAVSVGDRVLVTYTGTLSEVDPFTGAFTVTVLSSCDSDDLGGNGSGETQSGDLRTSGITDPYVNPAVTFSNLTSAEDQATLGKALAQAGIKESYIQDYMDYVNVYNETAPKSVLDGWNTLDKINYDPYEINDVWVQKYPDFVGVCCRMAVFTLLRDDILISNPDFQKSAMWALAFDQYSFETMPDPYMTDENLAAYETFYAPIPTSLTPDKEVQKKVLEQALQERDIQFKNSDLKFIAMVGHNTVDEANPFLFIDHVGVIYEKDGSVYLLEKLAFQEPYQWIEFPSEEEIIRYFEAKYNLDTTGNMAEPIYMINDKLI